ncbi:MAG: tetratricopeptide repeat protein [Planctomycetota bacterium]
MNDWQDAERHVERAHELYELGQWDEAESALRQAIEVNPYQAEWHFNLGLTLAAAGRSAAAKVAFERSHDLGDGLELQSCLEISALLLDSDRPEEARPWLEEAVRIDSNSVDAHVQLIDVHALGARHEEAELHFYLAIQLDPANASAYATLAESLIDRRQLERALWCLQQASKLDAALPRVFARMAYTCSLMGRQERARQLYLREIRQNPGDADSIVDLGRLLIDMHRPVEAGEKLRRALELVPDHLEAHLSLGELALAAGDQAAAARYYQVVAKLDPTYGGVRRRLARVHLGFGSKRDIRLARVLARQELADIRREADSAEFEDVHELAELLLELSLAREAEACCALMVASKPSDATGHHLLSVAAFASGRTTAGIAAARHSVRLRPDFIAPMHNLAVAYLRRGEILRAKYWVRHGLEIESEDEGLRRLRAYMRFHSIRSACGRLAMLLRPTRRTDQSR